MTPVCPIDALGENETTSVVVNERRIVLVRSNGEYFALEDRCSHQDTPLSGGRVRRGYIACPLHGVMFDLKTGAPNGTLTKKCVQTYPVEIIDKTVHVGV